MPPREPPRWTSHWPVLPLLALAALTAVLAHAHLFPAMSWNRDEPVYLWNVDVLRHGQLTATDGGFPRQLGYWLSAAEDGRLFTQYTPGWPAVLLAARMLTGSSAAALPLSAMLAVGGTYALGFELTQRRRPAVLAAALLLASPILAIQSGVYLSYVFTLGAGFLAGALLLSGWRRAQTWRVVAAGLILGGIFLTRPYDALLWGGAFSVGLLVLSPAPRRDAWRSIVLCALAAVPAVVVALLYNRHVTGAALRFPITVADPLDTFGFGTKRLMPGLEPTRYDPYRAVRSTLKNGFIFPWFLVGGYLGVILAIAGAWIRRRDRAVAVLLAVTVVFPLGYLVFWGTFLSSLAARISGPIYLVPLYGTVCILAAFALDHWWEQRRGWVAPVMVVLLIATVPGTVSRFDINRELSVRQEAWGDSVADLDGPSLVLVADTSPYLLYTNPDGGNGPDLDDEVLYAAAGGPETLALVAAHPERRAYLQSANLPNRELGPREHPKDLEVFLTPAEVVRGDAIDLVVELEPPVGTRIVDLGVATGAAERHLTLDVDDLHGPVTVRIGTDGLATQPGGMLIVTVGYGDDATSARATPLVRRVTPYRRVGPDLEVLTPLEGQRFTKIPGTDQWLHADPLPELTVSAVKPAR